MTPEAYLLGIFRRTRALLGSRGGWVTWGALALATIACAFIPLADHLGFEFAMVLTIVGAVVAPVVGATAITREREKPENERAFGAAAIAAGLVGVIGIIGATILILLNGFRRPTCEPLGGAAWVALLPIPTVILAASIGALARAYTKRRVGVVLTVIGLELIPLLVGLSSIYWGPSFFLFDHLFGYFPGPLYDETVLFTSTIMIFRAATLAWAIAAIIAVSSLGASSARLRRFRLAAASALALGLLAFSALEGTSIGFRSTEASVEEALGGVRKIDHLELHFPREWNDRTIDLFMHDAAFRASQVESALGLNPKQTVRVWMYRSPEEKRRLVGAASTSFAKPWRHEIHIHQSGWPHPVIRHELVHAFAGEIAGGPFNVPGGLFPVTPLIEGLAVAMDQESEGMTLEQSAKAMRAANLAPNIPALLSATGFYATAPSRAYTYAGAFIRFLQLQFGKEKVLELYRTGDLSRLGEPETLVKAFEEYLDRIPVGDSERATAERRFSRPSVFRRNCAREVSLVVDDAQSLMAQGKQSESISKFEDACAMEPDDPALLRNLLSAEIKAKNTAGRDEVAKRLFSHPKLDPVLRASVLSELGDDAWRNGQLDAAAKQYAEAAALPVDPQNHRNAIAHAEALKTPARAQVLKPLFLEGQTDAGQLFRMHDYLNANPNDGLVEYLLGRQLVQRDAEERGIPLLESALKHQLPDVEFAHETDRLLVRAYAEQHRCTEAQDVRNRMSSTQAPAADLQFAADWIARCVYETARGWSPL